MSPHMFSAKVRQSQKSACSLTQSLSVNACSSVQTRHW